MGGIAIIIGMGKPDDKKTYKENEHGWYDAKET
jgi:hypothetical protein